MKKHSPEIVPLTPELARRFYGHAPVRTMKGVAATDGDSVLGVAGVFRHQGKLLVFSELSDELRKDKRTIVRGVRAVLKLIAETKMEVVSIADESVPGSEVLLEHLGFTHFAEGIYQWHS